MYRIIISYPSTVNITITDHVLTCQGVLGKLFIKLFKQIKIDNDKKKRSLVLYIEQPTSLNKTYLGTVCSLVKNAIKGVTQGHIVQLELVGIGYKTVIDHNKLLLYLGYSHPINVLIPDNIVIFCIDNTSLVLFGINKQEIYDFAIVLRKFRYPEIYKGKGIRFLNEKLILKIGKRNK